MTTVSFKTSSSNSTVYVVAVKLTVGDYYPTYVFFTMHFGDHTRAPVVLFFSSRTIQLSLSTLLRTETVDELSTASVRYASCQ